MSDTMSIEEYKALPTLKGASPCELAEAICDILENKKGKRVKMIHVEDKTVIAEYFVLCTGNSSTQVKALADEVEYKTSLRGLHPTGVEGRDNRAWILLDYGSVIVHVFSREARDFYNLDKLYGDTVEPDLHEADDEYNTEDVDDINDIDALDDLKALDGADGDSEDINDEGTDE